MWLLHVLYLCDGCVEFLFSLFCVEVLFSVVVLLSLFCMVVAHSSCVCWLCMVVAFAGIVLWLCGGAVWFVLCGSCIW